MRTSLTAFALLVALLAPRSSAAQATPYVALLDPAYVDLDVLVAAGFVRDVMVGERPYSEAAFRRFVAEAYPRVRAASPAPRAREALARLERRFGPSAGAALAISSARADLTLASSPDRPARAGADGHLDATINPLLQRNQGRTLVDGLNAAVEAEATLRTGFLAGAFRPRVHVGLARGDSADDPVGVQTVNAYGRAVLGPLALEVGRVPAVLGFGMDGGPLRSTNPRALDQIGIRLDRPLRLPWALGRLGLWAPSFSIADLGSNRDQPGSWLATMRLGYRPTTAVEVGFTYLNQQAGEGAPRALWWQRTNDLFLFWQKGFDEEISDKVLGADVRIAVSALRSALYANFATTDDRGHFSQPAHGYWHDAMWIVGAETLGLGPEGRLDLRLEWRHDGPRAHTHAQFTSGMTEDGRLLGDALGPNAAGVLAAVGWSGPRSRLTVTGAWERYSGDDWYPLAPLEDEWAVDWYRIANNPDEVRVRLVADYLRFEGWRGLETSVRVGWGRVARFGYGEGGRNNVVGGVMARYRPAG